MSRFFHDAANGKFYDLSVDFNGQLIARWGSVGKGGTTKSILGTMDSVAAKKLAAGYVETDVTMGSVVSRLPLPSAPGLPLPSAPGLPLPSVPTKISDQPLLSSRVVPSKPFAPSLPIPPAGLPIPPARIPSPTSQAPKIPAPGFRWSATQVQSTKVPKSRLLARTSPKPELPIPRTSPKRSPSPPPPSHHPTVAKIKEWGVVKAPKVSRSQGKKTTLRDFDKATLVFEQKALLAIHGFRTNNPERLDAIIRASVYHLETSRQTREMDAMVILSREIVDFFEGRLEITAIKRKYAEATGLELTIVDEIVGDDGFGFTEVLEQIRLSKVVEEPDFFSVEVLQVPDKITKIQRSLGSSDRIKELYKIHNPRLRAAWDARPHPTDRIATFWHGTSIGSVASILQGGFIVPEHPTNGAIYGVGIYLATTFHAAYAYARHKSDGERYLFIVTVDLGVTSISRQIEDHVDTTLIETVDQYLVVKDPSRILVRYMIVI